MPDKPTNFISSINMKNIQPVNSIRSSNLELLRIFCMFLIVIQHVLEHGARFETLNKMSINYYSSNIVASLAFVAVNCFVLISGYFGMSFSLKKFTTLILQTSFYLVSILLILALYDSIVNQSSIIISILDLTQFHFKGYWFIKAYLLLMLLAPLISQIKGQFLNYLFVLVFLLDIVSETVGFPISQSHGHNILHFVFLYILGGMLKKHVFDLPAFVFALFFILTVIVRFYFVTYNESTYFSYSYNNLFVLLSSLLLFMFFLKLKFQSFRINTVSRNVLAIYLISDNIFIRERMYIYLKTDYFINTNIFLVYLLVVSIIIFVTSYIIDLFKRMIVERYEVFIVEWITNVILNFFRRFVNTNNGFLTRLFLK